MLTTAGIINKYFEARRVLLEAGTPLAGIAAYVHPSEVLPQGVSYLGYVYGAEWFAGASVPLGDVRVMPGTRMVG